MNPHHQPIAVALLEAGKRVGASLYMGAGGTVHSQSDALYLGLCGTAGGANQAPQWVIFGEGYDHLIDTKPVLPGGLDVERAFSEEIGHFVDCLQHGKRCVCPPGEGVAFTSVIDAVYDSARTVEPRTVS